VSGHGVLQSVEVAVKIPALNVGAMRVKHRNGFALNLCA
jgi:hypothetical protein